MFNMIRRLTGDVPPYEYLVPTASETFALGEALKMASGKCTKSGATDVPKYICVGELNSDGKLPVIAITPNIEFETISTATVADTIVGSKVTLHTDGLSVTATTTSGVFRITYTDGATTNSVVRGFFD